MKIEVYKTISDVEVFHEFHVNKYLSHAKNIKVNFRILNICNFNSKGTVFMTKFGYDMIICASKCFAGYPYK